MSTESARPAIISPKFDLFPPELTVLSRWILWRLEFVRERWTKVPYQIFGAKALTSDPRTWASFEAVRKAYELARGRPGEEWSGIGFCRAGDQLFADLDRCFNPIGAWADWKWRGPQPKELAELLAGTGYLGRSPGRSGLHAVLRSTADLQSVEVHVPGEDHCGIALYKGNRFLALTGEVSGWRQGDLSLDQADTHREIALRLAAAGARLRPEKPEIYAGPLSDDGVLRMMQKDPKFAALYDGHWEHLGLGDSSQSGADFALIQKLVFYTGGDKLQVRRIFGMSKLYREEKGPDYFDRTFDRAAEVTSSRYEPRTRPAGNARNGRGVEGHGSNGGGQEPPEVQLAAAEAPQKPKKILCNLANACKLLRDHPEWKDSLVLDEFAQRIFTRRPGPWGMVSSWNDGDTLNATEWFQLHGLPMISGNLANDAVVKVAGENKIHPLREWLKSLKWDGEPRLDAWLPNYLGAEENLYTCSVGRWWLLSAVARNLQPGVKADYLLVLEGPQGIGKSMALEVLAVRREWFTDEVAEMGTKDAGIGLQGKWVVEFSELDTRRDFQRMKAFASRSVDHFRPPYGRIARDFPRQCIFAASTNKEQYLDDDENRRYWPVKCGRIRLGDLRRDVEQLYAEAVERLAEGPALWPEGEELLRLVTAAQSDAVLQHPWTADVLEWCWNPTITGVSDGTTRSVGSLPGEVYVEEILKYAVQKTKDKWTQVDSNIVVGILKKNGFAQRRKGKQSRRVYIHKSIVKSVGS